MKFVSYVASMVWTGEQLACCHGGDVVESGGLLAAAARRPLQHVHQVGDEEVVLQCRHTLLRQDRGLAAHRAGQCEAVGRDVVLQTPGRGDDIRKQSVREFMSPQRPGPARLLGGLFYTQIIQ